MPKTMALPQTPPIAPVLHLLLLLLLLLLPPNHVHGSLWSSAPSSASASDTTVYDRVDRQPIHALRHHQHQPPSEAELVTQGPRAVRRTDHQHHQQQQQQQQHQVNIRHHSHRNRHVPATSAPPMTTTTTSRPPPVPVPLEEHRLRHSNKMYKPYALIESHELDFGGSASASAAGRRRPVATPRPFNLAHRSRQSAGTGSAYQPSLFNVTSAMQRRYFDRDSLYLRQRAAKTTPPTTTSTTTTTTTTPPPPTTVRMRHSGGSRRVPDQRARTKPFLNTYDRYDDPYYSGIDKAVATNEENGGAGEADDDADDDADDGDGGDDDDDDDDDYDDEFYDADSPDGRSVKTTKTAAVAAATTRSTSNTKNRQRTAASNNGKSSQPIGRSMLKSAPSSSAATMMAGGGVSGNNRLEATGNADEDYDLDELDELDGDVRPVQPGRQLRHRSAAAPAERDNYTDEDDTEAKSYIPGTLTEHKLLTLGTSQAAAESRRLHKFNEERASAHIMRISADVSCRRPRPKVVPVQTDPLGSKTYIPHCTILHRCGDDTGCCSTDARTCVAKHQQTVDLYFFVNSAGSRSSTIEKQTFVNHTECHCVSRHQLAMEAAAAGPPQEMRRATVISCTCPTLYETVLQSNGECRCDCSSGNTGCGWKKSGREHFSVLDRKCIGEGRCKLPECEYGSYDKLAGRCPRKDEKMRSAFKH